MKPPKLEPKTYIVTISYDGGMTGMREEVEIEADNYDGAVASICEKFAGTDFTVERLVLKLDVPEDMRTRNRAPA